MKATQQIIIMLSIQQFGMMAKCMSQYPKSVPVLYFLVTLANPLPSHGLMTITWSS